jgi:hypothetical protein
MKVLWFTKQTPCSPEAPSLFSRCNARHMTCSKSKADHVVSGAYRRG